MASTQETSEESASKTQHRKFTHLINRNLVKREKACARRVFLRKCLESKVIPNTLVINPPHSLESMSPQTANKYKMNSSQASVNNLRIALKDANAKAHEECTHFNEFFNDLLQNLPDASEREELINYKRKREPQIASNLKHKFHQKIVHLKNKQHTVEAEPDTVGFKAPNKPFRTQRRFLNRNRYRKWKVREAQKKIDLITNYSSFTLTKPMITLLNRGLSFVPTPAGVNKSELIADFSRYERCLRWKEHFFEEQTNESDDEIETEGNRGPKDLFKLKKSNLPQTKPSPGLSDYIGGLRSDILGSVKKKVSPNISKEETKAIKELKQAQSEGQIVIKPADKGGGICIMDKTDYVKSLEKQLKSVHTEKDGTLCPFYSKSNEQEAREIQRKVSHLICEGVTKGYISKQDGRYMEPSRTPGRLYGLPKCHKQIKEGEKLPPLRPIISNSGAITEQISHFVDIQARPQVIKMASYVEDTPDLLRQFEAENAKGPQESGTFPVTIDIVNMYGNIPHQGGLAAFEKAMNKRDDTTVPTYFLVALLSLVLQGNIFEFAGQLWRQLIGTAMGTRSGPTYANLFMGDLEVEKLLGMWPGTQPKNWRRYIDDIFFLWKSSEKELLAFLEHLNAQHPYIKFTITYDLERKTVPFLDTQVTVNESGFIETDLYKKSTAKVQYLLPSSCHPSHICKNIPFSLGYRLLRICSKKDLFLQRLQELKEDLVSRSYHVKIIQEAFDRLKSLDRSEALKKVTNEKENERELLAITFHPGLPQISRMIKKHHGVMTLEPILKRCFPEPSMVAYKRSQNLANLLVRAKVTKNKQSSRAKNNGFKTCERACEMCLRSQTVNQKLIKTHSCQRTGKSWPISAPLTCLSRNVVYRLTCKKCPQSEFLYIGETKRRACDRFTDHRGYVTQGRLETPAGEHFSKKNHTTMDMNFLPIERVLPQDDDILRKARETVWIRNYDATAFGKNSRA